MMVGLTHNERFIDRSIDEWQWRHRLTIML